MTEKTRTHPITESQYEDQRDYNQSLIDSFIQLLIDESNLKKDKALLVAALDETAGFPEKTKGTLCVPGHVGRAVVTRKTSVKYETEKGKPHPLRELLGDYDKFGSCVRFSYAEKGKMVQDFMDRVANGIYDDWEKEVYDKLLEVRSVNPLSPSVSIKFNKAESEDDASPTVATEF